MCDAVGFKAQGFGQQARACFAKAATVFFVKVPLTANGLFAVHQDASFLTQLSVEKFLTQLFSTLGVLCKVTHGAKEMGVIANVQRQVMGFGHGSQVLQNPPFSRSCHDQFLRSVFLNGFVEFTRQAARVVCVV